MGGGGGWGADGKGFLCLVQETAQWRNVKRSSMQGTMGKGEWILCLMGRGCCGRSWAFLLTQRGKGVPCRKMLDVKPNSVDNSIDTAYDSSIDLENLTDSSNVIGLSDSSSKWGSDWGKQDYIIFFVLITSNTIWYNYKKIKINWIN